MRSPAIWVLAIGVSLVACASNPTKPTPLPLGPSFELRPGASASLEGGLTVAFDRVASDSRCPMDALCVWAGDATLAMRLSRGGESPAASELHTQPNGSEVTYSTYRIKLVSLAPYPRSDRQIRPEDYIATFSVNQR